MNSPHPSTTCAPILAAWFLRHSRYRTKAALSGAEVVDCGSCGGSGGGGGGLEFDALARGVLVR